MKVGRNAGQGKAATCQPCPYNRIRLNLSRLPLSGWMGHFLLDTAVITDS